MRISSSTFRGLSNKSWAIAIAIAIGVFTNVDQFNVDMYGVDVQLLSLETWKIKLATQEICILIADILFQTLVLEDVQGTPRKPRLLINSLA